MNSYYLITFSTTHYAISAQNCLRGKVSFTIMPTLREITESCGISMRFQTEQSFKTAIHLMERCISDKNIYRKWQIINGVPMPFISDEET